MVDEKRREQNRESQRRWRAKKQDGQVRKKAVGTERLCVKCGTWKDEDDFRVRGRGREKTCLDCGGGEGAVDRHRGFEERDELFYALQRKQGVGNDEKP